MTLQEVQDDGTLWFFIGRTSDQAHALGREPRLNLSVATKDSWVSVAGRGEIVVDRARIDDLWNTMVDAWFPHGKDDPEVALLRVHTESAEYWASPAGGTVGSLVAFVKAKVSGTPPRGENEATDLT